MKGQPSHLCESLLGKILLSLGVVVVEELASTFDMVYKK